MSKNSLNTLSQISVNGKEYDYYSLPKLSETLGVDISKIPFSIKVLLENLLRKEDGTAVTSDDVKALAAWQEKGEVTREILYSPSRVLMQDFTGVPAVVDLAAMRDAVVALGGDAKKINPLSPVDLVIDHSVMVDKSGTASAFEENVDIEMKRNRERYEFLRWGAKAFDNFRVVPPGTGICHQVNLEYLAKVVWTREEAGRVVAYPDTVVGTDSHTTMINGLAVLGWGVGGIEAESAMLGQPISMVIPKVVGFKLTGKLSEGTTATDLVLTITSLLRKQGVVGKFVEFHGSGLHDLPLSDRATIANMAPEYGATCGFFPVDDKTIDYLTLSARDDDQIALVKEYSKVQGMWHDEDSPTPIFSENMELDISTVEPSIAGPKLPHVHIKLSQAAEAFQTTIDELGDYDVSKRVDVKNRDHDLGHGDLVIAAITSCTNTSNPNVMIAAGLVAKKAVALGLKIPAWVKTSLAPGSQVVTEYLADSGLQKYLDELGFNIVGYGCTTCIGNSGPLDENIDAVIRENDLVVGSVLSGNRNFEGRVHSLTKVNYLASPPLVVAYALAGNAGVDITKDAITKGKDGQDVYLKDIWPSNQEVNDAVTSHVKASQFKSRYADVFSGDKQWQEIKVSEGLTYNWNDSSTYIKNPPYFEGMTSEIGTAEDITNAKVLLLLGDSITTDHISPAGSIANGSPAAKYLEENGVSPKDFNSYGSRRGNHDIMMRGTFANIRIKNEMLGGKEGGYTLYEGQETSVYDAAMKYKDAGTSLVVIGGKQYGTGSSRDWAAKGTVLLGVKAVIAESFERIHRSNLVGMGVLPFEFKDGKNRQTLGLDGSEQFDIIGLSAGLGVRKDAKCIITKSDGSKQEITLLCRLDTENEIEYYLNGGILHNVLRNLAKKQCK